MALFRVGKPDTGMFYLVEFGRVAAETEPNALDSHAACLVHDDGVLLLFIKCPGLPDMHGWELFTGHQLWGSFALFVAFVAC